MDTIVALHQSWIGADAAAYVDRVTSDVTRSTSWSGGIQSGPQQVAQGLPNEWGFLELAADGHTRSANMTIRRAEVSVQGETARALYWADLVSGETTSIANHVSDWAYGNRGLILQAFVKEGGCWKLSHESDSWGLAYDPVAKMPAASGTASFRYDFTYPVKDLARAVRFYSTFVGEPEVQTPTYAAFDMGGPRLVLDNTGLDGFAPVRPGLPNGYNTIYVDDLAKTVARLEVAGTKFLTGIRHRGSDLYAIGSDPAGNVFVFMERVYPVGDYPPSSACPPCRQRTARLRASLPQSNSSRTPGCKPMNAPSWPRASGTTAGGSTAAGSTIAASIAVETAFARVLLRTGISTITRSPAWPHV